MNIIEIALIRFLYHSFLKITTIIQKIIKKYQELVNTEIPIIKNILHPECQYLKNNMNQNYLDLFYNNEFSIPELNEDYSNKLVRYIAYKIN
jgi:hypothetical protein